MADLENEEIVDGPRVSSVLEFGGTEEQPRTRDRWWFRSMTSDSEPGKGLIIRVARRPRTRRGELPHPTLRLMCEDPNGILYAKVKSGELRVESYVDFHNRMVLQARDEEAKKKGKK